MGYEKDQIESVVRPIVGAHGAFVVDVNVRGERGQKVIEIFADTDQGITTDSCASLSREILPLLENIESLRGKFSLVVSSPGLDRPMKFSRQYPKNIGRTLIVKCKVDERVEQLDGELVEATDKQIALRLATGETRTVPFDSIVEARVKARW